MHKPKLKRKFFQNKIVLSCISLLLSLVFLFSCFVLGVYTNFAIKKSKISPVSKAVTEIVEQTGFLKQIEYIITNKNYFNMMTKYTDALAEVTMNLDIPVSSYSKFFLDLTLSVPPGIEVESFSFAGTILIMIVKTKQPELIRQFLTALYILPEVLTVQSFPLSKNPEDDYKYYRLEVTLKHPIVP